MCSRELLDRVVLVLVDQRRIGLAEHAADRLARLLRVLLHLPVGEQRQLLELLVERHLAQQALDPALDAVITSRPLDAAARPRHPSVTPPPRLRPRSERPAYRGQNRGHTTLARHDASSLPTLRDGLGLPRCSVVQTTGYGPVREVQALGGAHVVQVVAAVVALLVFMPVANASAHGGDLPSIRADDVGVVRRDDRPALRPAGRHPQRRRHAPACRRRRRTSAPTCGARSPPSGSGSSASASSSRGCRKTLTTLEHMERYQDTGQYYNWYDHRTGAKLTAWPPSPTPNFHPILSSVDNGWLAVGLKIVENSVPQLRTARRRALRRDGLRLLLPARRQPRALPLPARRPGRLALLLRHRRQRVAGSSTTSASAAGSCRRRSTTGAGARSRTPATGLVPGDAADRRRPAPTSASTSSRAPTPYAGMQARPVLGRQHVRGADAVAVRARGEVGAATAGASTIR